MNTEFNLVAVIRILLKWKKQIAIFTIATTLAVAAYAFIFMEDYFLSYATFYPINLAQNDRLTMFSTEGSSALEFYGSKDDINRMLTIAQSTEIAEMVINKYNLADHYKINKKKKYWRTKVRKEFDSNYKALKTDENAIEVSILDTDPKLAAAMVADIVNKVDEIFRASVLENKKRQLELLDKQLKEQQAKVERNGDSLAALAKLYNIVVKIGTGGVEIVEGTDYKAVQQYKTLSTKQRNAVNELNDRTNVKEQMQVSMESNASAVAIVDKPSPADHKVKPIRSLIILTTLIIAIVVGSLGALMIEQVEDIRKQL